MGKDSKKGEKERGLYAYYVELESELDFARHMFGYSPYSHINAIKEGGKYRLLSFGERLKSVRMIYYTTTSALSNLFVYIPAEQPERFEMRDKLSPNADFNSYKAPIVELLSNPYSEVKDLKKAGSVIKVGIKDPYALAKSLASRVNDDEPVQRLYAFYKGKDHIIGTFDFIHEGSSKIFTYAKIDMKDSFGGLRYDYATESVKPVNSFADRSAIYIRVINLKNPFPFF